MFRDMLQPLRTGKAAVGRFTKYHLPDPTSFQVGFALSP